MQFSHPRPTGHREKHFNTLVALMCGLVGGRHAHLSTIADHAPAAGAAQASLGKRFTRWVSHAQHTHATWFLPVAEQLLARLVDKPLQVVMDGSTVGRGCMALMVRVVYHGRALPVCWLVVRAKKGHLPEELHRALLEQVYALVPTGADVTFLGDGEFDGVALQSDIAR